MKLMNRYCLFIYLLMTGPAVADWPYWPQYDKTPLTEIRAQQWRDKEDVIEGWDWSLPPGVEPSPYGLMAIKRSSNLNRSLTKLLEPLDLPINPTVTLWIRWASLEPQEGTYQFNVLRERIAEAQAMGYSVVLRILCSATTFAPKWMESYGIPIRAEHKPAKVKNYDISDPRFHQRYLRLVNALGESGIPKLDSLKGAFEGVEHKVFMGGVSTHGLDLGFGIRRGFVEMYLYHIPDNSIGQRVDDTGYLWVDESAQILSKNAFHGEENEEYEEKWATAARDFRFGQTTESYPYRYFTSNLRLLQMRCNYVLYNPFSIMPEQLVWVGQNLGHTVQDAPDVWCALRESYVRKVGPVMNFERWLYQRDSEGFETQPAVKIEQPIQMWMVEPGKYYDYVARQGEQIGFAVDDRWCGGASANVAIKTTYFDLGHGAVDVIVHTKTGPGKRSINLTDTGDLKTATFFFNDVIFSARGVDYDIVFKSTGADAVLSFVRVIKLDTPGLIE